MKKFLHHLIENISIDQVQDYCFIFPSKRMGFYFKDYLKTALRQSSDREAVFLPEILTFSEFVSSQTESLSAHSLDLIFRLYRLYLQEIKVRQDDTAQTMSFDKFIPFGKLLLDDFNEIDMQLGDAEVIYSDLVLLKQYDQQNVDILADYEAVRNFLLALDAYNNTEIKKKFVFLWEVAGVLYKSLKKSLEEEALAFDGMIYRKIAESGLGDVAYKKIIFAGFNAFTKSEASIVEQLLVKKKASVFWDADAVFINRHNNPAGKFIRELSERWKPYDAKILYSDMASTIKNIKGYGVALQAGQPKVLGIVLKELFENNPDAAADTVLILPDQTMLSSVLYSLPENVKELNLTMGFALKNSLTFSFIESVFNAIKESVFVNDRKTIPLKHIYNLIRHPFIYYYLQDNDSLEKDLSEKGHHLIALDDLSGLDADNTGRMFSHIYRMSDLNGLALLSELLLLVDFIEDLLISDLYADFSTEVPVVAEIKSYIKLLNDINSEYQELAPTSFSIWKILKESLFSGSVAIEGNAVDGLQVMGPMETRSLGFKNVLILSANEGIYPAPASGDSLLPYQIKKYYKLPVADDWDANYSYQFFNLIQRAENVYYFYNTEASGAGKGEVSRFFTHLRFEFLPGNPQIAFDEYVVSFSIHKNESIETIEIEKDKVVLDKILSRYSAKSKNSHYLSPTALSAFLSCGMKFYFQYVAGIKEKIVHGSEIEAMETGTVIHRVIELLYEPYAGKPIQVTEQMIRELYPGVEAALEKALLESSVSRDKREGFNELIIFGIKQYIHHILRYDASQAPFRILATEQKIKTEVSTPSERFYLGGKIDHVREKDGVIYLIDYKTGNTQGESSKKDQESLVEDLFTNYQRSYIFQLSLYGYLYKKGINDSKPVRLQLFYLKENRVMEISKPVEDDLFEQRLKSELDALIDPELPFVQVSDKRKCIFCAYKSLCNRV